MAQIEQFEQMAAGGREVTLEFEAMDAKVPFSNRRGEVARKRVPPMKLTA